MFEKILVVCHGNICRSPLGEALLKQLLPETQIQSAGLGALVDKGAEPTAQDLAKGLNLNLSQHKARQFTSTMVQWADLVLVMSECQRGAIAEKDPTAIGKTMLFGQWLTNPDNNKTGMEIPDPYRKSHEAFAHVQQLMSKAASQWQQKLN